MLAVPACSALVLAGTFTCIPLSRFVEFKFVLSCPFTFMLPPTKLVPSGISSLICISLSKSPVFVAVIVYVITSPSTTYPKPFSVSNDLLPFLFFLLVLLLLFLLMLNLLFHMFCYHFVHGYFLLQMLFHLVFHLLR